MKWDEQKIQVLKDEYPYCNLDKLAKKLNTTVKSVRRKAESIKLKRATNNQIVNEYKYCTFCEKEHHISQFYRNKSASYGYEYYCILYYKNKKESIENISLNSTASYNTPSKDMSYTKKDAIKNRPINPIVIRNGVKGKICNMCKSFKPLDDYWADKNGIGGKKATCSSCYKDRYSR